MEEVVTQNKSKLQRHFTKKSSSFIAASLISEMKNETKDRHEFLTLVILDAAKVFNVLGQVALSRKMCLEGVGRSVWLTLLNM